MDRRPITGITTAFILGTIIQYHLKLPVKAIWMIIFAALVLSLIFTYIRNRTVVIPILLCTMLLGGLNLGYRYITEAPIKSFVGKNVEIIGDCIQEEIADKNTYILYINEIRYRGKSYGLKNKTLLKVYKYKGKGLHNKRILVKGILKVPDKARNPGMFDYNLYLKTKGINTLLNTSPHKLKVIGLGELPFFIDLRHNIKDHIYNGTFENFPGNEGKVALSIAFGDKKIINKDLYEAFKTSGTAHALAVSGLHFGILFMVIDFVLQSFKLREKYKVPISIFLIWFFAFIVGFTPSVIRASSMITFLSVSNIFNRRYDLFSALSFICLLNIVVNPFMIFNIGFQLSFSAVVSIGLFYKPIYEKLTLLPDYLRQMFSVTLAAQIGTSPIIAYYFNNFSPISLIINIPVVLLVSIVLPISLVFFIILFINPSIAAYIALVDKIAIKLLIWVNSLSYYVPFGKFNVVSPKPLFIITFYIVLILIFHRKKIPYIRTVRARGLTAVLMAFIFIINAFNFIYPKKLKLTFVDVGQGDCILIETPKGKRILVDGGKEEENFLSGFLLRNNISYVDLICVSHIHSDHIGGIGDVVKNLNTGLIAIGTKKYTCEKWEEIEEECRAKDISIKEFTEGSVIELEKNLTLRSVYPKAEPITNTNEDMNNNSLVLILKYKEFEVLLTGDIEKEAELDIIKGNFKSDVDVIKVAHHGSNTSSTPRFIDLFKPEIAVIQVGKNSFGHPHRDTLDKLRERGIRIYRNDKNGAVIVKTNGENIEVKTMLD